ncbi:MAG: phosphoglycerate kinase [Acidimicrobiia bacterium]|nr:phosphoglycerate kinase [Acidimicrobiia bacterium]MDX2466610.1 phosphoglycerate kinase [Acidimicrobiia bacterium]
MGTTVKTLPTLDSLRVEGKTVLVRSDLNVPLDNGEVADDFRIGASLPTIQALLARGAKVVVCSHLGRPKGVDEALRLDPVADRLSELGGFPVNKIDVVAGEAAEAAIAAADAGTVTLLENTRFEPGEKKNDPDLADALARLADVFVLDAFGTAHRAHATTVGVAERLPAAAGYLLEKEVRALSSLLSDPERPYLVILGGAKVSDKLAVMEHLLPRVDRMIVGGGMCFTLLKAQGYEIGNSLVEESRVDVVGGLLDGEYGHKIMLPTDVVAAKAFAEDAEHVVTSVTEIPDEWMGLDIGPKSIAAFRVAVDEARSVFWNGPMGVFEWESFRAGTAGVAEALANTEGFTVIGGGDSVAAIRLLGREDQITHVSSGGGAGLEFLEGKKLPGITALERWNDA